MRFRDLIFVLLINLIWGVNFVAGKYAVNELPPLLVNTLRFGMVTICLLPFLKIVPGHMRRLLIAAFTLGAIHFGCTFVALSTGVDVSAMAIIAQLNVPFSTVLAMFILREKVGLWRGGAIAVSFAGVAVLSFEPSIFTHLDAVIWTVVGAFSFAVATILMRQLKDVPAMTVQAWVGLTGVFGSMAASLLVETGQLEALSNVSLWALGAVTYSALLSSVVGHGGLNHLLRRYDVSVLSPYMLTMPIFAVLASIIALDESLTGRVIFGGVLTMAGVVVVTIRNNQRAARLRNTRAKIAADAGA